MREQPSKAGYLWLEKLQIDSQRISASHGFSTLHLGLVLGHRKLETGQDGKEFDPIWQK